MSHSSRVHPRVMLCGAFHLGLIVLVTISSLSFPRTAAAQIESSLEQPVIEEELYVIYKGEACNTGDSTSAETSVMDMIHTPSEGVEEMKIYIGELSAGACVPWEHNSVIGDGIPPGKYELYLQSGDYKSDTVTYTVPNPVGQPDLKISIEEVKIAGGEAQLVYQVCNRGAAAAQDYTVGLFLGDQPKCEDKPFFKDSVAELLADTCQSFNSDIFTYEPEQVKVWAFVDYLCAIEEENDRNNISGADLPSLIKKDPEDPKDPDPDVPKQPQAPSQDGGCTVASDNATDAAALLLLLLLVVIRSGRAARPRGG